MKLFVIYGTNYKKGCKMFSEIELINIFAIKDTNVI